NGGDGSGVGAGGPTREDKTEASEPLPVPEQNYQDNVAPRGQPQSDLVLRKLRDLVENDQVTPEMLRDMGMSSKEELDQFVEKYTKRPDLGPSREGQEIEATPGKPQEIDPNRKLPDLNPSATVNTQTLRDRGSIAKDDVRGNNEGVRFVPPPEYRSRFDAYRSSLSRTKAAATPR
ncbi:MAG: hypothetical protein AB7I30_15280, partial [Isosphaeraceae bacterium]